MSEDKGKVIQIMSAQGWQALFTDIERNERLEGLYDRHPLVCWALYENGDIEPMVTSAGEVFNPNECPFREEHRIGYEEVVHDNELTDPIREAEIERCFTALLKMGRGSRPKM